MAYTYFLLFIIYSFIGWCMEVCLSLHNEKKFINRGFLLGPYCPIYGFGCLLLTLFLSRYQNDIWALFALTIIICSILEYVTSWVMEKIFKLRWWDYSNMKYNINGRICLETMIPFAIIGVIVIKYTNPFFLKLIESIPGVLRITLAIILFIIIIVDFIISSRIVVNIKKATNEVRKDSTEEIKKAINKFIKDNSYLYQRIVKAFPKIGRDQIKDIIKQKKAERKAKRSKK